MEFFDKDTEHLKYLDTLSGKFSYRSRAMSLIVFALGMVVVYFTARYRVITSPYILPLIFGGMLALSLHVPCSYSADEDGFSILSGLVSRHFSYSDVVSVTVENRVWGHTRNGSEIYENVLIVSTADGIYRFHESSGTVRRRSFMYSPDSDLVKGRHTELIRLKEFITSRI